MPFQACFLILWTEPKIWCILSSLNTSSEFQINLFKQEDKVSLPTDSIKICTVVSIYELLCTATIPGWGFLSSVPEQGMVAHNYYPSTQKQARDTE